MVYETQFVSSSLLLSIYHYCPLTINTFVPFRNLGLTGSIVLRSGRLSDLIAQLHELLKGVNEAEILSEKYDGAIIRAQVLQLLEFN